MYANVHTGPLTRLWFVFINLLCLYGFNFDWSAGSLYFVLYFNCFIFLLSVIFFRINELISVYFDLNQSLNING